MTKAKIENGLAVQPYPYTLHDLHADHPGTSFPKGVWPADAAETFNVVDVAETTPPTPTATQSVTKALPALIASVWTQQWTVRDWTAQEIADHAAAVAEAARLDAIDAAVDGDSAIAQILDATNAQIDTYVDQNVTNLAQARTYLKRLTKLVLREMRRNRGL
jgi:hypothetical protein